MKKLFLLGLIGLFTIVACQQNEELTSEEEEVTLGARGFTNLENEDGSPVTTNQLNGYIYQTFFIQYNSNTTEQERQEILAYYSSIEMDRWTFFSLKTCTQDIEIWTFVITKKDYINDLVIDPEKDNKDNKDNSDSEINEIPLLAKFTIIEPTNCD